MHLKENSEMKELSIDNLFDKLANNDNLPSVILPKIATTFNSMDEKMTTKCTDYINTICSNDPGVIKNGGNFLKTLEKISTV